MRYLIIHTWEDSSEAVGKIVTVERNPEGALPERDYASRGLTPVWCVNVEFRWHSGYHPREWLVPISDPDAEDKTTEETLTDKLAA